MLTALAILVVATTALGIGAKLGRRREPKVVGSVTVPMIEAVAQRVMIGVHDMTVVNMVIDLANVDKPRTVTIDFVDSAEWEKQRRIPHV